MTRTSICQISLPLRTFAGALLLAAASLAFAQTSNSKPPMAGAFPSLPGTAWKIESRGSTGVATFLFCKSGRWEVVPGQVGHIGAVGTSYKVSGSTLTTTNADDGKVEKYQMTWKDEVLELNDGKATLRLRYNGETSCK